MACSDFLQQKAEWKRKGWSIPELRGKKQEWFRLVVELVQSIGNDSIRDLSFPPDLKSMKADYPWCTYAPFLKGVGLVSNRSGTLQLTESGLKFCQNPSQNDLAFFLHDRYRLFGEILKLIQSCPKTVEEVDQELCREYGLNWVNLSNTRRRMDWLEVLDLIHYIGNRKWGLTDRGLHFLSHIILVTPQALESDDTEKETVSITPPPAEVQELLQALKENPSLHKKRNTYNTFVPSPNRIENLRIIVQYASERVTRAELFRFIEEEFGVKTSSVESMMPSLKADGLLEEVGRNIYTATPAAKAWCESGNDLDFIRILHAHKRFVGELLVAARRALARNDIYAQAGKYGLNTEKTRWIIGFLLEAGLLEETQYLHIKTTPLGLQLADELPMWETPPEKTAGEEAEFTEEQKTDPDKNAQTAEEKLFGALCAAAKDPMAAGNASGVAFEEAIAAVFRYMGFEAKRVGGSGDTDVVVRWTDQEGKTTVAIIDGKSKTGSVVTHSDISDVAIETHKEKNSADFVAIIGPGFGGDTIKNHARKKGFSLITVSQIIDIAKSSRTLGLSLTEIALLFKVPNGLSQLEELLSAKKREMEIVTLVISTFMQEQEVMSGLSARDLFFLLRQTNLSPSLDELIHTFEILSKEEIGVLTEVETAPCLENVTYLLRGGIRSVNRLRALASAIEKGLL